VDTETLTYFDRKFLELKTDIKEDIKAIEVIMNNTCTKLAVFDSWRETVDKRCSARGEDVKRLDIVEKKLDSHILTNGFTDKEVKNLKAEVKPYSEWATTGKKIMQFIGVALILASFYFSVLKPIFSQPKTTTNIGVTK
jgi:hypothetical protein